uniref:glucose-6-phosphatase n=1 Tax=Cairina moschata TaxID=8855 RepID=A0A8C3GLM9_CAIMO
ARRHRLFLRQFPITCETGPGSPSGHCMITGAALWPLVTALSARAAQRYRSPAARWLPVAVYLLFLLAVGLSRVFVLAHFPHQVLGGIVAGVALGWGLQACPPPARSLRFYGATALGLLLGALGLHRAMAAAGIDIDWSIRLASSWCSNPSWLRLDTRPFASVCRDAGSALGLGLALNPPRFLSGGVRDLPPQPQLRVLGALLALGVLEGLQRVPQPAAEPLWYGAACLRHAAGPCLVAVALPRLLRALGGAPPAPPHAE